MTKQKIAILMLILACYSAQRIVQQCQNLLEISGKCSDCSQSAYLYQGYCYQKMEGCYQYLTPQFCFTCQFGYNINGSQCTKDLDIEFKKPAENNIAQFPVYLNRYDITIKLSRLIRINQGGHSSIQWVSLRTNTAIIIQLFYSQNFTYFRAGAKIDYQNKIEELFFLQNVSMKNIFSINQLNNLSKNRFSSQIMTANLQNISYNKQQNKLTFFYRSQNQSKLYKVQHSLEINIKQGITIQQVIQKPSLLKAKQIVIFFAPQLTKIQVKKENQTVTDKYITYDLAYRNGANIKLVFDVANNKYEIRQYNVEAVQNAVILGRGSRPLLGGYSPLTNYLDSNMMATKQQLYQKYPQLNKLPIVKAQLQVVNGVNIKLTFENLRAAETYVTIVSRSLTGQILIRSITRNQQSILRQKKSNSQIANLLGGFTPVQILNNQQLESIVSKIKIENPQIKDSVLEAAGVQVVSGLNYKVVLMQSKDTYVYDIYQNLHKQIFILDANKNGMAYFPRGTQQLDTQFDWRKDQIFKQGYEVFKKEINILNFLPIQSVMQVKRTNQTVYTIVYSQTEFGVLKYFKDTNRFQVISYILQGTEIYQASNTNKSFQDKERTTQQLFEFLKKQKPQYFANVFLKNVFKQSTMYILQVGTPKGVFQAQIQDKQILQLKKLKLLSKYNCFEGTNQQIKNDQTINRVIKYARTTMSIDQQFRIQIVQIQVNDKFFKLRLLFVNSLNKKLQVYVNYNSNDISITNSKVLNEGYEKIPFQQLSQILLKANPIAKNTYKDKLINSKLVDAKKNLTNIKLVYSSKQFTSQVVLSQDLGKAAFKEIQDKRPKLPQGYNPQNIIKQEKAEKQQFFKVLMKKIYSKFDKYIEGAPIILIQQQNVSQGKLIKILFDCQEGVFQAIGRHFISTNQTEINSFSLTKIRKSSFLQCESLNQQNCECENNEIYIDGFCFDKIEGCQLQVGNICINCEKQWNQADKRCIKECFQLF